MVKNLPGTRRIVLLLEVVLKTPTHSFLFLSFETTIVIQGLPVDNPYPSFCGVL